MRSILIFAGLLATFMAVCVSGCGTAPRARSLSVLIAITPMGAESVSPAQVAQIHHVLKPSVEAAGYTLAENDAAADLVLTVSFIPIPGMAGGRIKLISLEPSPEFRRATATAGESAESKQMRRLERELQSAAEALGRNLDAR